MQFYEKGELSSSSICDNDTVKLYDFLPARNSYISPSSSFFLLSEKYLVSGLQICFIGGVYGSCVGFTKRLEHSEQLVPFVALVIGMGEMVGEYLK